MLTIPPQIILQIRKQTPKNRFQKSEHNFLKTASSLQRYFLIVILIFRKVMLTLRKQTNKDLNEKTEQNNSLKSEHIKTLTLKNQLSLAANKSARAFSISFSSESGRTASPAFADAISLSDNSLIRAKTPASSRREIASSISASDKSGL